MSFSKWQKLSAPSTENTAASGDALSFGSDASCGIAEVVVTGTFKRDVLTNRIGEAHKWRLRLMSVYLTSDPAEAPSRPPLNRGGGRTGGMKPPAKGKEPS